MTLLILCGFAYFLIPLFRDMFNQFGLTLPPPTILVFWLAEQTTTYLFRSLAVIFCLMLIIIPFVRYWRSRSLSNRLFGRLVAGTSSNLLAMASLANTLSHMLRLGAPLNEALRIAGTASRCYFYQRAAIELSNQIEQSANVAPQLSPHVFCLHCYCMRYKLSRVVLQVCRCWNRWLKSTVIEPNVELTC